MTAPTITEIPEHVEQEQDDPPRQVHYVAKDRIVDAMVMGYALMTLCGIYLKPGKATPENLPLCEKCKQELDSIRRFMEQ